MVESEPLRAQQIGSNTGTETPTIATPQPGSTNTGTTTLTPYGAIPQPLPYSQAPIPSNPATSPLFSSAPYSGGVSQTGEFLAESLQRENADQKYNLRVGPVGLRVEGDVGVTFNDNIGITKDNRVADILITPTAIVHGRWEVSDLNTLTFNIGVGYQAYLLHSQFNSVILSPDSEASFNFFLGDCAINLHDYFSYEQDPTDVAQLSNQVRLVRFTNDAGFSAQWDLNDLMVEASYDHGNFWVTQSVYDYLTNQSDTIESTVTMKLNETVSTGVNISGSYTRYEQSFENDNFDEQFGPFVKATLSDFLSVQASAGLFLAQYDQGGGNGDNSNVTSYYGNAGINHKINSAISESLTFGREYLPGLTSNYTERIYASYGDQWYPTSQISVSSNLFWENLNDSDSAFREESNRYGFNLNLTDSLSSQLAVNFSYQFLLKDADPSFLSYYQNTGTVGMQYQF